MQLGNDDLRSRHVAALAGLIALFAARVAAQALQRWWPIHFLPPFDAFQGSTLPYPTLLAAQLAILVAMASAVWRIATGSLRRRPRLGHALIWMGSCYFACMLARFTTGLLVPVAPRWLTAVIPAAFHLVLATFVVVLGIRYARVAKPTFARPAS